MSRYFRIFLHIAFPPLLGAVMMFLWTLMEGSARAGASLLRLPLMLLYFVAYGYIFAVIPSAVYASLMELGYSVGILPGGRGALVLSTLLGGAVGSIPLLATLLANQGASNPEKVIGLLPWAVSGLLTGAIVEWFVRLSEPRPLTLPTSNP